MTPISRDALRQLPEDLQRLFQHLPEGQGIVPVYVLGELNEGGIDQDDTGQLRPAQILPIVPQTGKQVLSASQSGTYEVKGIVASALLLDIPKEVAAVIRLDGLEIMRISDGAGRNGTFAMPDGYAFTADAIKLTATNNGSSAVDLGLWAIIPR